MWRLKHTLIAIVLVAVLIAVSASGCLSSTNNSTSSGGAVLAAEPTGGSWKTFVLSSSDRYGLFPPPSQGSPQFTQDVNELKALQLNRTATVNENIDYWNNGSVVQWNAIARSLVIKYSTSAPMASRVYALLSVAQYHALVSAWNNKYAYNRSSPHDIDQAFSLLCRQPATPRTRLTTPLSPEHPRRCSRILTLMKPLGWLNKRPQTTNHGLRPG